ncbi:MAG: sigma-70 family RNA polymerase sigma factor [Eubacteriales bacterium]|nr:sigma-70 family RNA polymerase sigma factor [Eubacteriales bacterium]MDY3332454.1 sigma-70 family RNA polymerase sigma factor [Gallibacter sp.]
MIKNEEQFIKYYQNKDPNLRNQIVEQHLYMVDILVKKYLGKGIEYDDLYQVGAMALISAVERFDPTKGFEFSSFATPTILGEIKKYFRDKGWSIKVPRNMKEIASSIPSFKEKLIDKLGRNPTVEELAQEMEVSEDIILKAMESSAAYSTLSINQMMPTFGDNSDMDPFEKFTAQDEKGYSDIEDYDIIYKVLKKLDGTNQYIFKKRFVEGQSQSDIAKNLGVSQMTISRAEKRIIDHFIQERDGQYA